MNGDAAEVLARARGKAAQSAKVVPPPPAPRAPVAAPAPEPVVHLVPGPAGGSSFTAKSPPPPRRDFDMERASESGPAEQVPATAPPAGADIQTFDGTLAVNAVAQDDALRVYQALLAQRPGDPRLRARVDGLSSGDAGDRGGGTGESVQTFLRRILGGRPPVRGDDATPGPEPLPDPESGGSPLDDAFAVAPPEPDPEPDMLTLGAVSGPADDSITLDAVFGEESPRSSVSPAEPAAPPGVGPAPATPPPSGRFSFDQFFSPPPPPAAGGATLPAEGGPASPGPPRASGSRSLPPMEDEGDLDQFQTWLRGLKS